MKNNLETINKILKKYQKYLNVKFKLICDKKIIFDDLLNGKASNILEFNIDHHDCILYTNKFVDLNMIKIALESYFIDDKDYLIRKALFNTLNDHEIKILKEHLNNEIQSLIIIQTNKKTEHLYSTISNIFTTTIIDLENEHQVVVLSPNQYDEQFLLDVKDTLETELYCKVIIAVSKDININNISKKYQETDYFLQLLNKYQLSFGIIDANNVLLPYLVESIKEENLDFIVNQLKISKFKELDEEMLMTIKMFLKSNLSISETARKMYIHRNTLIYRIEKILSITGYDIRNFEDASKINLAMILMKK